jgi:hypothetical protein
MKLPNKDIAVIDRAKLIDYLLNPVHRRGGSKAKFLIRYGYSSANWQELETAIRESHLNADVDIVKQTAYGIRYEISAFIDTPAGQAIRVRTVWQIDTGTDFPRLITLIPN